MKRFDLLLDMSCGSCGQRLTLDIGLLVGRTHVCGVCGGFVALPSREEMERKMADHVRSGAVVPAKKIEGRSR